MQGPVIIGNFKEKVSLIKARNSRKSANNYDLKSPVSGCVLLPHQKRSNGLEMAGLEMDELELELEGIPDDNRSMVFPGITTEIDGRGYALSIKGLGARTPLYGSSPSDFCFSNQKNFQSNPRELTMNYGSVKLLMEHRVKYPQTLTWNSQDLQRVVISMDFIYARSLK